MLPLAVLLVGCGHKTSTSYGLPITLGSSSDDVRKVLGGPTELYRPPKGPEGVVLEWYYSSGIVCKFDRDKLTAITLNKDADYPGFIPYQGTIVRGLTLTDGKTTILTKLGTPTKVEGAKFPQQFRDDVPAVWPKESWYYWRFKDYVVQIEFLDQAQQVSDNVVWQKDTAVVISVEK
jgi:hypothetical protein